MNKRNGLFFIVAAWFAGIFGGMSGDWQVLVLGGVGILVGFLLMPDKRNTRPWSGPCGDPDCADCYPDIEERDA